MDNDAVARGDFDWRTVDWEEAARWRANTVRWQQQYREATDIRQCWAVLRDMYRTMLPDMLAVSEQRVRAAINRDILDWRFSEIEEPVWITIRGMGLPFYPQFPAEHYFIDFANPYTKIGIETDGKLWHNPAKDWQRDRRLMALGWRIFRIMGSEVYAGLHEDCPEEDEEIGAWLGRTYDGLLTAIDHLYFREEPWKWRHFDAAVRALHAHRLMPFPIISQRESPPDGDISQWEHEWRLPDETYEDEPWTR